MKSTILIFATVLLYSCHQKIKPQPVTTLTKAKPKLYVISKEPTLTHTALDSFPGTHQRKLHKQVDSVKIKFIEQP